MRGYEGDIDADLAEALRYACQEEPIGAYAVDYADAELKGSAAQGVIHVRIVFRRSAAEIAAIVTVSDSAAASEMILDALENYETAITLRVRSYQPQAHSAMLYAYCLAHPDRVVAIPTVTEAVYPETGDTRIVELHFDYPESRDELARRQQTLNTILRSAATYVSRGGSAQERLSLLHRFLVRRFVYTICAQTPQMPAYSLLCEGQAHSLSFAIVVQAQCQAAGVDCMLVTGTRNGLPHYWNLVWFDGVYYHLDLQRAVEQGEMELHLFEQTDVLTQEGYVWDKTAYPANPAPEPEPTQPSVTGTDAEPPTEPTEPPATGEPTQESPPPSSAESSQPEETEEPTEPEESQPE